jgi:predicted ATPase
MALKMYAYDDAITHIRQGLELIPQLEEGTPKDQQEQLLQVMLGAAFLQTRGFASSEVGDCFNRAYELCDKLRESPMLFPILRNLYGFYLVRGDMHTTREIGEELSALMESSKDSSHELEAYHALGVTNFHMGNFGRALMYFDKALSVYDMSRHRYHAHLYANDPAVSSLFYSGLALCYTGFPDKGLEQSMQALKLAEALDHPFNIAYAHMGNALIHQHRGEVSETQKSAEALTQLAGEYGFVHWLAWGNVLLGWTKAMQGDMENGITSLNQGINIHRAIGSHISLPTELGLLSEAYFVAGKPRESLGVIDEALKEIDTRGEAWWHAQLLRLKGEITSEYDAQSAESHIRSAITIAEAQGAKYFALQAKMSLFKLMQNTDKENNAKVLLRESYQSFNEGKETAILKAIKELAS